MAKRTQWAWAAIPTVTLEQARQKATEARKALAHETLVFPSPRGKQLTDMALTQFLRKHKADSDTAGRCATAHGFRSSFRDWASENGCARDLAEKALAHVIANKVEAAYHRTNLLEQRRPMMQAWCDMVRGREIAEKVVLFRQK